MENNFDNIDLNKMSPNDIKVLLIANQDLKLTIADNMKSFGGSFVKALAECVYRADNNNLAALVEGFLNYFIAYQPKEWKVKNGN